MLLLSVCGLLRAYLKTKKMASIPQSQAGSRAFSHKILLWLQKQAGFSTFQLHARDAACSQYSTNRFGLSRFFAENAAKSNAYRAPFLLPEQIMDFLKLEQVDPHGHGKAIIDHNSHPILDGGAQQPG